MLPRCPLDKNEERTLSLTHFYDVDHTHDEQPQNEVDMTIPLPYDYDGVGDLTVLTKEDDDRDDDDAWEILPGKPLVKEGRIHFRRAHFSTYVCKSRQVYAVCVSTVLHIYFVIMIYVFVIISIHKRQY